MSYDGDPLDDLYAEEARLNDHSDGRHEDHEVQWMTPEEVEAARQRQLAADATVRDFLRGARELFDAIEKAREPENLPFTVWANVVAYRRTQ